MFQINGNLDISQKEEGGKNAHENRFSLCNAHLNRPRFKYWFSTRVTSVKSNIILVS